LNKNIKNQEESYLLGFFIKNQKFLVILKTKIIFEIF